MLPSALRSMLRRYIWRLGGILLTTALCMGMFVPAAQADPHALYFTTVGQQQLFFNTLAALDQADYVETSLLRYGLLQNVQTVRNFPGGTSLAELGVTQTNLPAVLTRPITLEGTDAFTAQQKYDEALEIARRAGTNDLLSKVFCEALGREACSDAAADLGKRAFGFVTAPLQWAAYPITHGLLPALLSGTPAYTALRQQVEQSTTFQPGQALNPYLAALRQNVASSAAINARLDQDIVRTLFSFLPLPVSPDLFDGLDINPQGEIELTYTPQNFQGTQVALAQGVDPNVNYSQWYDQKVRQLLTYPVALQEAATAGAASIKEIQDQAEVDGEVADLRLVPQAEAPDECSGGTCPVPQPQTSDPTAPLIPTVEVPAAAKLAQVDAGVQALADLNTNLAHTGLEAQAQPEGVGPLLAGTVAGTTSETPVPQTVGQVLAAITSPPPIAPAARGVLPRYPHFENDAGHFLGAIKSKHVFGTSCGCGLEQTANAFGIPIMQRINELALVP